VLLNAPSLTNDMIHNLVLKFDVFVTTYTGPMTFPLDLQDMKPFVKKNQSQVVFPRSVRENEMKFRAVVVSNVGGNNNMVVFMTRKLKLN
jgi:hypothetical protein